MEKINKRRTNITFVSVGQAISDNRNFENDKYLIFELFIYELFSFVFACLTETGRNNNFYFCNWYERLYW